jgi:hypothetical protein
VGGQAALIALNLRQHKSLAEATTTIYRRAQKSQFKSEKAPGQYLRERYAKASRLGSAWSISLLRFSKVVYRSCTLSKSTIFILDQTANPTDQQLTFNTS